MDTRAKLGKSVMVKGSDKVSVPPEMRAFFEGRGMPVAFFRAHYGTRKGLDVKPAMEPGDAKLFM